MQSFWETIYGKQDYFCVPKNISRISPRLFLFSQGSGTVKVILILIEKNFIIVKRLRKYIIYVKIV